MCARCARSRRPRAATQFCGARENLDPGEPDARRSAAIDSGGGCGSGGGSGGAGSRVAVARSSAGWDFGGCERRAEWYFVHYIIRRGVRVSGASHSSRAAVEAVLFPLASAAGIDDPC